MKNYEAVEKQEKPIESKASSRIADNVKRIILEKGTLDVSQVIGLCKVLGVTPNEIFS